MLVYIFYVCRTCRTFSQHIHFQQNHLGLEERQTYRKHSLTGKSTPVSYRWMKEHWAWVGACHKVSCVFNNLSTHQKRRRGTHPRWGHSVVKIPWRRIAQVRGALWRESAVPQRGSYSSPPPAPISDCAPELTTHKHTQTKGNTLITLRNRNHHEFYPLHSITTSKRWPSVLQATKILFKVSLKTEDKCAWLWDRLWWQQVCK